MPDLTDDLEQSIRRIAQSRVRKLPPHAEVDADDLFQVGMVAAWQSIPRFDPARGVPFEAFALRRAVGAMLDCIRETDPLSRRARTKAKIAGSEDLYRHTSLDDPATTVAAQLATRNEDPLEVVLREERGRQGLAYLSSLTFRKQEILRSLLVGNPTSVTAAALGIRPCRVSQVFSDTIRGLRVLHGGVSHGS